MGDFYAGLGACSFEKLKPFGTISLGADVLYCSPDSVNLTTNRAGLQKAREHYEKAVRLLTEVEAANEATSQDKENLRIGGEKIEICAAKLNGKS
jgi:hypothetical protein